MGLLKNAERRSPPRAVSEPDEGVEAPVEAVAADPQGAVDTGVLDSLSARTRGRPRGGRRLTRGSRPAEAPKYVPEEDDAPVDEGTPSSQEAVTRQAESSAFTVHLDAEPTLRPPTVPTPEAPDPAQARARIEQELGIEELESSLAEYGTPPQAPPAKQLDRYALEQKLRASALAGIPRWKVGAARSASSGARQQAFLQAQAQEERAAAEREQLQEELDARWGELNALRERAADELDTWLQEDARRRDAEREEQQALLDSQWRALVDAGPDSVTETLRAVFPDSATTVLGSLDGVAVVVVTCPRVDEVIAPEEVALTNSGRRVVRPRAKTLRNELYLSAIGSRVLAAVGRSLSATPAIEAVTCVAVRPGESDDHDLEPIYVGTFQRAYAETLLAEGRWSPVPRMLAEAIEDAEEVDLEMSAGTHAILALELSDDPDLKAVMDRMDPAIRADESAALASDQATVRSFLSYEETESNEHEKGGDELAELQIHADQAAHQPTEVEATHSELHPELSSESDASSPEDAAPIPREDSVPEESGDPAPKLNDDPLLEALKDSDDAVRLAAAQAISRRNDPSDTPLLLEALRDRDENVRLEAMYALKDRLGPDTRHEALIEAAGDPDESVRRKAVETLAQLGDEHDTPLLLEALRDRDENVRLEAIYALKRRLAPNMRDALTVACGDADRSVRRKAIEALAELGDERDTPLLLRALKDSDDSVRLEAIYALESRSTAGSSSQLSGPLSEAMKDEDPTVRQAAVRLFGRLEQHAGTMQGT